MVTSGTETVLIGNIMNSDLVAVLVCVGIESLLDLNLVILLSRVLHVSMLLLLNSVGSLESELVGTVLVLIGFAFQDGNVLVLLLLVVATGSLLVVLMFLRGFLLVVMLLLLLLRLIMVPVLHLSRVILLLSIILNLGGCDHKDRNGQESNKLERKRV